MRLMHIGSGFRPWRRGGLVAYAEDLMAEQVRRGHEVSYFFSGRHYPYVRGPRLRRWRRDGVSMLEVVNSPLHDHGRQPREEVSEPGIERILGQVVRQLAPDAVHIQEMAGLPSSIIDVVGDLAVPVVLTLQDYFLLCSTFKLLDSNNRVCLKREIGAECAANTLREPRDAGVLIEATLRHDAIHLPLVRKLGRERVDRRVAPPARWLAKRALASRAKDDPASSPVTPAAVQRRRDLNVRRMSRADRVIAMSSRVAEIHQHLGVDAGRMSSVQLTLGHIEHLRPRGRERQGPLTFATLAGLESTAKGAELLRDALVELRRGPAAGRFRLLAFGYLDSEAAGEIAAFPEVELRGLYRPGDLDQLLDEVDVGLVTSIWEEAYGYVGVEFLAKGVPLIANAIGGITEYAIEGQTAWLNRSCSAAELADRMKTLVEQPELVDALSASVRAKRESIVKPMGAHADEMDAIYGELIA